MATDQLFENPPAKGDYMSPVTEVIRYNNENIILDSDPDGNEIPET